MGFANLIEGHSTVCDGCSDCEQLPDNCAECQGGGPLIRHTDGYDYCQPCAAYLSEPTRDEEPTQDIPLWCSSCERRFPSLAAMALDHACAEAGR